MRKIESHKVPRDNAPQVEITVLDEPGQGGACHHYEITGPDPRPEIPGMIQFCDIRFQKGPIKEFGTNGITQEALLAIVIDRLECFQKGPFACDANYQAIIHCYGAMLELQKRTRERLSRGVEGTNTK